MKMKTYAFVISNLLTSHVLINVVRPMSNGQQNSKSQISAQWPEEYAAHACTECLKDLLIGKGKYDVSFADIFVLFCFPNKYFNFLLELSGYKATK